MKQSNNNYLVKTTAATGGIEPKINNNKRRLTMYSLNKY